VLVGGWLVDPSGNINAFMSFWKNGRKHPFTASTNHLFDNIAIVFTIVYPRVESWDPGTLEQLVRISKAGVLSEHQLVVRYGVLRFLVQTHVVVAKVLDHYWRE
jgi:hypothetical protein